MASQRLAEGEDKSVGITSQASVLRCATVVGAAGGLRYGAVDGHALSGFLQLAGNSGTRRLIHGWQGDTERVAQCGDVCGCNSNLCAGKTEIMLRGGSSAIASDGQGRRQAASGVAEHCSGGCRRTQVEIGQVALTRKISTDFSDDFGDVVASGLHLAVNDEAPGERDGQDGQQGNDGDDHDQFDDRETLLTGLLEAGESWFHLISFKTCSMSGLDKHKEGKRKLFKSFGGVVQRHHSFHFVYDAELPAHDADHSRDAS